MADVIPLYDPTNFRRVHERIKRLWHQGDFTIEPHAQARMRERRVETTDIDYVIRYGRVTECSRPGGLWRYTLEGPRIDGGRIRCVVEINGTLVVVTVVRLTR